MLDRRGACGSLSQVPAAVVAAMLAGMVRKVAGRHSQAGVLASSSVQAVLWVPHGIRYSVFESNCLLLC
jgi:hypothetical protein